MICSQEDPLNKMKRFDRIRVLVPYGVAILIGLLAGCSSPRPTDQMSDTTVLILNRTPQEISSAIKETYKRHQFENTSSKDGELVFEKRGTVMNDIMSPNWLDGPTWVRVKVFQRQLDSDRTLIDYGVYLVQQPDDPMFQQEHPYGGHKKEFRSLMQEVARNLNEPVNTLRQ
jgi:hypothetical protein